LSYSGLSNTLPWIVRPNPDAVDNGSDHVTETPTAFTKPQKVTRWWWGPRRSSRPFELTIVDMMHDAWCMVHGALRKRKQKYARRSSLPHSGEESTSVACSVAAVLSNLVRVVNSVSTRAIELTPS
jgi:hypothetical protein